MTEAERQAAAEARRQYNRQWRAEHREELNAYHRQWRKDNPEKSKAIQLNYWKRKAEGTN